MSEVIEHEEIGFRVSGVWKRLEEELRSCKRWGGDEGGKGQTSDLEEERGGEGSPSMS